MEDYLKLSNQLCFKMYSASRTMTRLYGPMLKEIGLTYPQYLAMLVMWEKRKVLFKELGIELKLKTGTLTPLLKKLESMGYVLKKKDEKDDRQVWIELTQKGLDLKEEAKHIPISIAKRAGLTKKEYDEYMKAFDEILNRLYIAEDK